MKKIFSLLIIFLSFFLLTNKVYADDELPEGEFLSFDYYNVEITIDDSNKKISVVENFKTSEFPSFIEIGEYYKEFNSDAHIVESNYLELPGNERDIDVDDNNEGFYKFELQANETYVMKYEINIKNGRNYEMPFNYLPVANKKHVTYYKNFDFKINYTNNNRITINMLKSKGNVHQFKMEDKNGAITGHSDSISYLYDRDCPEISFVVSEPGTKLFVLSIFGYKVNIFYLIISICAFAAVIGLSIKRFKDDKIDRRKILIAVVAYSVLSSVLRTTNGGFELVLFIASLAMYAVYGMFYYFILFQDNVNKGIGLTIATYFIYFHSYFGLVSFNYGNYHSSAVNFFDLLLFLNLIAVIISSKAYKYSYQENLEKKGFRNASPEDVLSKVDKSNIKILKFENYSKYSRIMIKIKQREYFDTVVLLGVFLMGLFIVISLGGSRKAFFESYSDDQFYTFMVGTSALLIIIPLTLFIILFRKVQKFEKLLKKGIVINDIPFTYIYLKKKSSDDYVYKIKLNYNYNGKDNFISEKKTDTYVHYNKTCSMIIDPNDLSNYYIDFDIPKK